MARKSEQLRRLKAIIGRADRLAKTATAEWRRTIREIRKEVDFMTSELDVGRYAKDREKVIARVQLHIKRLERRLSRLEDAQMAYVGKSATTSASEMTGVKVDYSKTRADTLLALIRERNGGSMAATFTSAMSRTAVTALRNAVVTAFQEQAIAGGTQRELADAIRDKWRSALKNESSFKFIDRRGVEWDTNRYIQMNVRANSMQLYNKQVVDRIVKATGRDLVRVSNDGRTEKHSCDACKKWAGRILSVTGKDTGFPTIADAERDGLFHPNCIHTLEPVLEGWDDAEIAKQRKENAA